ncbi:MAG: hypothetical protein K0R29_377 [Pseudobdellovibrio sp.]|nr:hypothetical protein [Pseudobdellovibrio sp.]
MLHRKFLITTGLGLALLIAGLFLFKGFNSKTSTPHGLLKPSQMTFSQGNQFSEDFNAKPEVTPGSAAVSTAIPAVPENEKAAWQSLEEILSSKNDNDPRLDKQLSQLSPEFHKAIYSRYESLKPEDRNGRGTLVFLIARDLKSPSDIEFLQKVYEENPCLNMSDCSAQPDHDPQDSGSQQTSLNYPQLAGLYQIDSVLSKNPSLLNNPQIRAGIYSLLKTAENFPAPQVHGKAQQIREKYGL